MFVDKNDFFREATLRICGNLDFEIALQNCLIYLISFMPVCEIRLNLYDRGLPALRTIAVVRPEEVERVDVLMSLDARSLECLDNPNLPFVLIINRPLEHPVAEHTIRQAGPFWDHSQIVMHLKINGTNLGNLIFFAAGFDRYTEEHAQLLSWLNEPFTLALSNALRYNELNNLKEIQADQIRCLQQKLHQVPEGKIIGANSGLRGVIKMAQDVAPLDTPVLLQGETGVGKEVIANAIHAMSRRKKGPFIPVNCGAIPETLIDSELFGHEKGAFTGAIMQKRGCFERAEEGTIFLDEIAELPPQAQIRLLRVLEDKKIVRVGGSAQIKVDIRVIAATHQNLQDMVRKGLFRADLWFRLNVFPIEIPPLRERKDDIPALVDHVIHEKTKEMRIRPIPELALGAIDSLRAYSWPGNVRELENVVERALILGGDRELGFDDILWVRKHDYCQEREPEEKESMELDLVVSSHIRRVLQMTKGRVSGPGGAAEILKLNYGTLRHRMKKLGIAFKKRTAALDRA
ncbi:MAG: sigma-54 dependent transcriptional regulator [Syntrophorhabdales bacterium]|jgi:transcriptional regulator with GAF, ATPase, and Fis domain